MDGGDIELEIWQRTLYVSSEIVSVGDHWYQYYGGEYVGNQLRFDYYNREGLEYGEAAIRDQDEYEYTQLAVADT